MLDALRLADQPSTHLVGCFKNTGFPTLFGIISINSFVSEGFKSRKPPTSHVLYYRHFCWLNEFNLPIKIIVFFSSLHSLMAKFPYLYHLLMMVMANQNPWLHPCLMVKSTILGHFLILYSPNFEGFTPPIGDRLWRARSCTWTRFGRDLWRSRLRGHGNEIDGKIGDDLFVGVFFRHGTYHISLIFLEGTYPYWVDQNPDWYMMVYGYGSIPINTIFRGVNILLPAILMFTRGTRFWHTAIWNSSVQCG